jgi:hypothetical protein
MRIIESILEGLTMRTLTAIVATVVVGHLMIGCAQTPSHPDQATDQSTVSPSSGSDQLAKMDAHLKAMREMREQIEHAQTPEERQALRSRQTKQMREATAMLENMGHCGHGMGMMGKRMSDGTGKAANEDTGSDGCMRMGGRTNSETMSMSKDNAAGGAGSRMMMPHQIMEKRMEMVESMLQIMIDRLGESETRR